MLKKFIRDTAIYAIPSFISRGLGFILIPLYTRVLAPADYGALDLLTVFGSLVSLTVALEISQGVARYYTGENDPDGKIEYASTAFWFAVFCYTLFVIVAFTFSKELSAMVMGRHGMEMYFRFGSVYIGLNGVFYLIQSQFRWELRSKNFAAASIIVSVITAGLAILFTYVFGWGLAGVLFGMASGVLTGCIYGLWNLSNTFQFRFRWMRLKEMLLFSAPLVPSGIAVFVNNYIDRVMINHYLSLNEVGLYGVAFRLAGIIGLVMIGFQGALTPLVYKYYRDPQTPHELARIFRLFLAFALMVFLILSLFASEVLHLMTTPAYYPAAQLIVFLVPAILLSNMYIFTPGISIVRKTHLIMWINVASAGLNTLFCWLLIPRYGITGAAVGTLLGYCCVFFLYLWFSQRLYFVPHDWKRLMTGVGSISILAYWIPRLQLSTGLAIGLKLGGVALGILVILSAGLVQVSELQQVQKLARNYLPYNKV